jgi:hypothetical protein
VLPTAPAPTASLEERQAYLAQHDLVDDDRPGFTFKSGATTYYPQDLKPAVAPTSSTAKVIERYERDIAQVEGLRPLQFISTGAILAGVVTTAAAGLIDKSNDARDLVASGGQLLVLAGGVTAAVHLGIMLPLQFDAAEAAGFVAGRYPAALREQLAIGDAPSTSTTATTSTATTSTPTTP